jgi:hypothetical protein
VLQDVTVRSRRVRLRLTTGVPALGLWNEEVAMTQRPAIICDTIHVNELWYRGALSPMGFSPQKCTSASALYPKACTQHVVVGQRVAFGHNVASAHLVELSYPNQEHLRNEQTASRCVENRRDLRRMLFLDLCDT